EQQANEPLAGDGLLGGGNEPRYVDHDRRHERRKDHRAIYGQDEKVGREELVRQYELGCPHRDAAFGRAILLDFLCLFNDIVLRHRTLSSKPGWPGSELKMGTIQALASPG